MSEILNARIAALHASYVAVVNQAVEADDIALADELARAFDADARQLTREHLAA